jgi:hypothetical protein
VIPFLRQIVHQTRELIFRGNTHTSGKLVRLFEPHTEIMRTGKAAKPTGGQTRERRLGKARPGYRISIRATPSRPRAHAVVEEVLLPARIARALKLMEAGQRSLWQQTLRRSRLCGTRLRLERAIRLT